MRKNIKVPRILKIEKISGFRITCMFNNGESRILDFEEIFRNWNIKEGDVEFPLLDLKKFMKVKLRNKTLSWDNVHVQLMNEEGDVENHPYEIDPITLFKLSKELDSSNVFKFGTVIRKARKRAGLTQEQLAERSGTSRFYISKLENNKTDIELSTFRKIVEAGLGKQLKLAIE